VNGHGDTPFDWWMENEQMSKANKTACLIALERMGCALADHKHRWTKEERDAFENALAILEK
jgi:hypothetical protein